MSTTSIGKEAEELIALQLMKLGHKIRELNWKNRWCEIDIVSTKEKVVYFTEVKYRSSDAWGGGFDYIGPSKLKQMSFAAEFWLHENKWRGESQLQAAEVGPNNIFHIVELR